MLIILEGPDGAGKTTLARAIQKVSGASYLHCTYRLPDQMPRYHTAALMHALSGALKTDRPVILDRWWPSEYIYGDVFRGGTKFPHYGRLLDRLAIRFGALYVTCLPSDVTRYLGRFKELAASGREKFVNLRQMLKVYETYDLFHYGVGEGWCTTDDYLGVLTRQGFGNRVDALLYDFHRMDVGDVAETIVSMCGTLYESQGSPKLETTLVGNLNARTMIVGDKPNLKWADRRPRWPFFEHGNCSLYLAATLDYLNISERNLCFANINGPGGVGDVGDWLNRDTTRPLVVLGNEAEATLLKNFKVNYYLVPHPQAWRRFPSYDVEFKERLEKALCDQC
jgi:hypothetical protein